MASKWTDLIEPTTKVMLPGTLKDSNGLDLICIGTAPKLKVIGFLTIQVWATGFYVDGAKCAATLSKYQGKTHEELISSQAIFDDIIKGGFIRRIYAVTCRDLTTTQISGGFRESLLSRLPVDNQTEIDPVCDSVNEVKTGLTIDQTLNEDNSINIKFALEEGKNFSSAIGTAILQSAFDELPLGKASGWQGRRASMIKRLPDVIASFTSSKPSSINDHPDASGPEKSNNSPLPTLSLPSHLGESHENNSSSEINKTGFLMKKMPMRFGVVSPTWEKRAVILNGHNFSYRRPEEKNDRMLLDIRECIVTDGGNKIGRAQMGKSLGLHHVIVIIVKSSGKELRFSSENQDEAEEWLYLLQEAGASTRSNSLIESNTLIVNNANHLRQRKGLNVATHSAPFTPENNKSSVSSASPIDTPNSSTSAMNHRSSSTTGNTIIKETIFQRSKTDRIIILFLALSNLILICILFGRKYSPV